MFCAHSLSLRYPILLSVALFLSLAPFLPLFSSPLSFSSPFSRSSPLPTHYLPLATYLVTFPLTTVYIFKIAIPFGMLYKILGHSISIEAAAGRMVMICVALCFIWSNFIYCHCVILLFEIRWNIISVLLHKMKQTNAKKSVSIPFTNAKSIEYK